MEKSGQPSSINSNKGTSEQIHFNTLSQEAYEDYIPLEQAMWSDLTQQVVSEFKIQKHMLVKAILGTDFDPADI